MTSIHFEIVKTCHNQFNCNYLKNKKNNSQYFPQFLISSSNLKHFEKKKMTSIAYVFKKLKGPKHL